MPKYSEQSSDIFLRKFISLILITVLSYAQCLTWVTFLHKIRYFVSYKYVLNMYLVVVDLVYCLYYVNWVPKITQESHT